MIKLEAMRVFVTVAELGNIKDASDQLGRTGSAISMTLKQIEEELGGPLFESDRKNALTALGQFVLNTGRGQIRGYDRALSMIHDFAQSRIGSMTLASVPSVVANLIPPLLHRFIADRPGIEIELVDTDSRAVHAAVESGAADLGIAGTPRADSLVSFQPLFRDRFRLICSSESRFSQRDAPVDWSDLEDQMLILNGAVTIEDAPGYQKLAEKTSVTVRNVTSLIALVKEGLGVTLLPALSTIDLPQGVMAVDLADTKMQRQVGFVERRNAVQNPAAAAFRGFVQRELPPMIDRFGLEVAD
ncbi:LysR family transcriptional regulator [Hoeflea sp. TYP-13]|uniref:LysR family transcriptional regulator n=1 Tax=Hoeflea sp. TYP-13 TaxID=3230023 RepID=UPI0034C5D6E3